MNKLFRDISYLLSRRQFAEIISQNHLDFVVVLCFKVYIRNVNVFIMKYMVSYTDLDNIEVFTSPLK